MLAPSEATDLALQQQMQTLCQPDTSQGEERELMADRSVAVGGICRGRSASTIVAYARQDCPPMAWRGLGPQHEFLSGQVGWRKSGGLSAI
jgi:hypothetical protein